MNTDTTTTTAAPRIYGVPSFVVSAEMSSWPDATSKHRAPKHRAHGTLGAQLLPIDVPNPTAVRDARVAAKQDRPPRGVPR